MAVGVGAAGNPVPVPELAGFVKAPALHGTARNQRARVPATRSDARRCCDANDGNGCFSVGEGTVPELTIVVPAPKLYLTVREQRARVANTTSDVLRVRDANDVDRGRVLRCPVLVPEVS